VTRGLASDSYLVNPVPADQPLTDAEVRAMIERERNRGENDNDHDLIVLNEKSLATLNTTELLMYQGRMIDDAKHEIFILYDNRMHLSLDIPNPGQTYN
jgi:hypothetical protein